MVVVGLVWEPIGLKSHLAPFISNHRVAPVFNAQSDCSAVSAAPYGSANILPISWMYITMMGRDGLLSATKQALPPTPIISQLSLAKIILFYILVKNGRVAHECIIDIRPLKAQTGISETDIAKRLMDYGFHAPTMSFPVAGTLMIEPTESGKEKQRLTASSVPLKQIKQEALKGCKQAKMVGHQMTIHLSMPHTPPLL